MRTIGMPAGMWALFAGSFQRKLTDVLGYDRKTAARVTKAARREYRKLIGGLPDFEKGDRFRMNIVSCAMLAAFVLNMPRRPRVDELTAFYTAAMMTEPMKWFCRRAGKRKFSPEDIKGMKETMTKGNVMDTLLNIDPRDFLISKNDEQTMTSPELKAYINKQKARGVANIKNFEIEYERRIAMTAAAFILTIIGLSLSSRKVRGGIGLNIGLGLLLSFSYILFMTVTSTFAVSGYTSPRIAMWIPNFVYIIIAAVLYYRASR